jgi:hypothetical protein
MVLALLEDLPSEPVAEDLDMSLATVQEALTAGCGLLLEVFPPWERPRVRRDRLRAALRALPVPTPREGFEERLREMWHRR